MPTEIVNGLTDDQVALIGCCVALIVTGTMMSLSFYIGQGARNRSTNENGSEADVIPLPAAAARGNSGETESPAKHREAA